MIRRGLRQVETADDERQLKELQQRRKVEGGRLREKKRTGAWTGQTDWLQSQCIDAWTRRKRSRHQTARVHDGWRYEARARVCWCGKPRRVGHPSCSRAHRFEALHARRFQDR